MITKKYKKNKIKKQNNKKDNIFYYEIQKETFNILLERIINEKNKK